MEGEYRLSNPELKRYKQGCMRTNKGAEGFEGCGYCLEKALGSCFAIMSWKGWVDCQVKGQMGQTQCPVQPLSTSGSISSHPSGGRFGFHFCFCHDE